jgi:hypothetical protein
VEGRRGPRNLNNGGSASVQLDQAKLCLQVASNTSANRCRRKIMKAFWLSTVAVACLVLGGTASAGDRGHRDNGHRDHGRGEQRHDYRGNHWGPSRGWHNYRPVYYRPVPLYRPVYYAPAPVYYGPVRAPYGYGDGVIHGTISVGF